MGEKWAKNRTVVGNIDDGEAYLTPLGSRASPRRNKSLVSRIGADPE